MPEDVTKKMELDEARRWLAQDFARMVEYKAGRLGYQPPQFHIRLAHWLQGGSPPDPRLWRRKKGILGFRFSAKSWLLRQYLQWRWMRCPFMQFVIQSSTEPLARKMARGLKDEMAADPVTNYLVSERKSDSDYEFNLRGVRPEVGFSLTSIGINTSMTSSRCDLYCHAKGTRALIEGDWMCVEDHESAIEITQPDGYHVTLNGLPLTETVTPGHRYWCRQVRSPQTKPHTMREPRWVQACNLDRSHWIGFPIDLTEEPVRGIRTYQPGSNGGQDWSGGGKWVDEVHCGFDDEDWWWLIGLWWGDGCLSSHRRHIVLSTANSEPEIRERVYSILRRYERPVTEVEAPGCLNIGFTDTALGRWLYSWKTGKSAHKVPPQWVERMPIRFQLALIRGYFDADGYVDHQPSGAGGVRLTSVCLDALLCVRRMLMRIGVASTIRKGAEPRLEYFPNGYASVSQQKYDLRISAGASKLGFDIVEPTRYTVNNVDLEEGHLWCRVRDVTPTTEPVTFVPINTESRDYVTDFGRSHNCLDDCEGDTNPDANHDRIIQVASEAIDILHFPSRHLEKMGLEKLLPPEMTQFLVVGQPHTEHTVYFKSTSTHNEDIDGGHPLGDVQWMIVDAVKPDGTWTWPEAMEAKYFDWEENRPMTVEEVKAGMPTGRWECQYRINPQYAAEAGTVCHIDEIDIAYRIPDDVIVSVDPADSAEGGCEWGVSVLGTFRGKYGSQIHICYMDGMVGEVYEGDTDDPHTIGESVWCRIFDLADEYGARKLLLETNYKAAATACTRYMRKTGRYLKVEDVRASMNKLRRICIALEQPINNGMVTANPGVLDDVRNKRQLVKLRFDELPTPCDRIDALAQGFNYLIENRSELQSPTPITAVQRVLNVPIPSFNRNGGPGRSLSRRRQ